MTLLAICTRDDPLDFDVFPGLAADRLQHLGLEPADRLLEVGPGGCARVGRDRSRPHQPVAQSAPPDRETGTRPRVDDAELAVEQSQRVPGGAVEEDRLPPHLLTGAPELVREDEHRYVAAAKGVLDHHVGRVAELLFHLRVQAGGKAAARFRSATPRPRHQ